MLKRSIALLFALAAGSPAGASAAGGLSPEAIGARLGTNAGDDVVSDLHRYDVFGQFKLPWGWRTDPGLEISTNLEVTAGVLRNDEDSSFIASVSPGFGFSDSRQRIHLGVSLGLALVPDYRLGPEDFGGPIQVTYGGGISLRLFEGLVLGYRAQHFSDARIYGSDNRGVDMHMLELRYRFGNR
jgi:hypothetical protein